MTAPAPVRPHVRKLKVITLDIGGENFEVQLRTWNMVNNTEDGEKGYTFSPDGEYVEDTDPDWALELTFLADWKVNGVSDYLTVHGGDTVPFILDHHPDRPEEHVRWTGDVKLKKPSVGGDARATELTEITLACVGEPVYARGDTAPE